MSGHVYKYYLQSFEKSCSFFTVFWHVEPLSDQTSVGFAVDIQNIINTRYGCYIIIIFEIKLFIDLKLINKL